MEFILQNNDTEKLQRLTRAVKPLLSQQFLSHLENVPGVTNETIVNIVVSGSPEVGGGVVYAVKLGALRNLYAIYEEITQ